MGHIRFFLVIKLHLNHLLMLLMIMAYVGKAWFKLALTNILDSFYSLDGFKKHC